MSATKSTSWPRGSCPPARYGGRDDELDGRPSPSCSSRTASTSRARTRRTPGSSVWPGLEAAEPDAEPVGVASVSSANRVSERLLEEQAVDREQEVVDAVERELEARRDPAEHEATDARNPALAGNSTVVRSALVSVELTRSRSRARRVVAIGVDREDPVEQGDLEDALDVRVGADDADRSAATAAAASRPRAARRGSSSR